MASSKEAAADLASAEKESRGSYKDLPNYKDQPERRRSIKSDKEHLTKNETKNQKQALKDAFSRWSEPNRSRSSSWVSNKSSKNFGQPMRHSHGDRRHSISRHGHM